jgi:hypothetical protein
MFFEHNLVFPKSLEIRRTVNVGVGKKKFIGGTAVLLYQNG